MLDIPESFQGQFPLPSSNPHATEGKRLLLYRQKPFGLIPVGWDQWICFANFCWNGIVL